MPSPKGGAAIVFGKIQIIGGQSESLNECRQELMKVLKQAGYPEQVQEEEDDESFDLNELDEEIDEELAREKEDDSLKENQKVPWSSLISKDEQEK